jgi:hypothetical protein
VSAVVNPENESQIGIEQGAAHNGDKRRVSA